MGLKETLTRLREEALDRDPAARIVRWTDAVASLYAEIEGWLAEYAVGGLMAPHRERITMEESVVGPYETERLAFDLPAGRALILAPVGLDILDAEGRVDMYELGARSQGAMLLLNPKPSRLAVLAGMEAPTAQGWFLRRPTPTGMLGQLAGLSQRPPEPDVKLTRTSLEAMIEELLG